MKELEFMLQNALELYLGTQQELTARNCEGQKLTRTDFGTPQVV